MLVSKTNVWTFSKKKGKISNKEYQKICEVSKGTATKELRELIEKFDILAWKGNENLL